MAVRSKGMNRWWGGAVALVLGTAACSSVFESDEDCTASRTCPPADEAASGAAGDGGTANVAGSGSEPSEVGGQGGSGAAAPECSEDADCDDDDPANGVESCGANGTCRRGDAPPAVVTVTPGDGEEGVAVDTSIAISFSEELAEDTVTAETVQLLRGDEPVDVELSYAAGTIKLEPRERLVLFGEYQVVVSREVSDLGGSTLLEEWRSTFQVSAGTWEVADATSEPSGGSADRIALDDEGHAFVAWGGLSWLEFRLGVPQGDVQTAGTPGGDVLLGSLPQGPTLLTWRFKSYVGHNLTTGMSEGVQAQLGQRLHGRLEVFPDGMATLFRHEEGGGTTAFVRTSAGWSPSGQVLATEGVGLSAPQVAIDAEGNAIAVWRSLTPTNQHRIMMSTFSPNTASWSQAAQVQGGTGTGPAQQGRGAAPTVATSPDGVSVALWVDQPVAFGPCVLWSKSLTSIRPATAVTDVTKLEVSCHDDPPGLVFDGETFVAAFTATEKGKSAAATYTMRWDMAAQTWGAYEKRQAAAEPATTARMPRLGTDGAGSLFLLWSVGTSNYELYYQRFEAGRWSESAAVPRSAFKNADFVQGLDATPAPALPLAMNRFGMVAISWEERSAEVSSGFTRLRFASLQ